VENGYSEKPLNTAPIKRVITAYCRRFWISRRR